MVKCSATARAMRRGGLLTRALAKAGRRSCGDVFGERKMREGTNGAFGEWEKKLFLSALLLAAYLSLSTSAAAAFGHRKDPIVGGWQPIKNLSDPHVQKIAKFAVDEHNKIVAKPLRLISVESGYTQIVSGVNYRLIIVADRDLPGTVGKYEATVWEKSWENFLKLTSFKSLSV